MKRRLLSAALALVMALGALTTPTLLAVRAIHKRNDAKAVVAYAKHIEPLAKDGGELVVTEMRPSIKELGAGTLAPEQFRQYAERWHARFLQIRSGFSAAPHGGRLQTVASVYDRSLRLYISAIDGFVRASQSSTAEIQSSIAPGIKIAESADATYDTASRLLSAEFKRLGLAPIPPAS
ncbi:MAG: hypothetical protein ABR507_01090 [Actinomycetota bacterium]